MHSLRPVFSKYRLMVLQLIGRYVIVCFSFADPSLTVGNIVGVLNMMERTGTTSLHGGGGDSLHLHLDMPDSI